MPPESNPQYCPVCRNASITVWSHAFDYEYFSVRDRFTYYACNECGTIFIHPVPLDKLREIYPANYYSFVKPSSNPVNRIKEWFDSVFFKKVLGQIKAGKINVLDVGGGTGWLLNRLRKTDSRIHFTQVVDIDKHAKKVAEENGHNYFQGIIESFTSEKRFHLVLMLNLIEHVADPYAVLEKAASLLSDDGFILIKTPNTKSLDAKLFRKTYWGGLHCPRHWVIFSEKSFRLMLTPLPLEIKKLQYTQGAAFWAFSLIARIRRKNIEASAKNPVIFHWLFAPLSAVFATFDFIRRPFSRTSQMFIILKKTRI